MNQQSGPPPSGISPIYHQLAFFWVGLVLIILSYFLGSAPTIMRTVVLVGSAIMAGVLAIYTLVAIKRERVSRK